MTKNKKELIIESFQKMDSTMLEILLDESKTYQDATKEIFIEKLNQVFSNRRFLSLIKKQDDFFFNRHT